MMPNEEEKGGEGNLMFVDCKFDLIAFLLGIQDLGERNGKGW